MAIFVINNLFVYIKFCMIFQHLLKSTVFKSVFLKFGEGFIGHPQFVKLNYS